MEHLKHIISQASEQSEQSELFYMKNFTDSLKFKTNEIQSMTSKQSEGIALRVRKNGKIGFSTSTKFDDRIISNAIDSAEFGDTSEFDFASTNIKFSRENYFNEDIEKINLEELIKRGEHIIKEVRDFDKRINLDVTFEKTSEMVNILTSSGFNGNYPKNIYSILIEAELTRENDIFELWKGYSGKISDEKEKELIEDLIFDIKHGLNTVKIDSGKYPVIFYPDALEDLLGCFISAIDGNKIFRKTSPLYKKLEEQIFDERLNIYDDGTIPGANSSLPFDDEGTISEKTLLVEKGVLKNFFIDLKNSKKLNLPPNGKAFRSKIFGGRSYEYYPSTGQTTITIPAGKVSQKELLKSIKTGLIATFQSGFSMGNIQNGDFSATVLGGYKVENGEIVGRVKNTVISGNLYNIFKEKLVEISSETKPSIFMNSILPYILFKDVEVTS